MIAVCDFCSPIGDHDKPYRFGLPVEAVCRLTLRQRVMLKILRANVLEVQTGILLMGPAYGDIAADRGEWKIDAA